MNKLTIVPITKSIQETSDIKTIIFPYTSDVTPGQFFMIWIPGVDEIPMSVSYISTNELGITFRKIGEATQALFMLKPGEKIGIRGPFGNGFTPKGDNILFIGGGTGIAMIAPAVEQICRSKKKATVILGNKTKTEIFFEQRLKQCGATVHITTDDGSYGYKGYASDLAEELISSQSFSSVLTCGPEHMMKKIYEYCNPTIFQASLERYMKCAIGLCGQCCVGMGLRVCKEGPVFSGEQLQHIKEFGVYTRDASGCKQPV